MPGQPHGRPVEAVDVRQRLRGELLVRGSSVAVSPHSGNGCPGGTIGRPGERRRNTMCRKLTPGRENTAGRAVYSRYFMNGQKRGGSAFPGGDTSERA